MAITFQAFLPVLSALHKMPFSQGKNNIYAQWHIDLIWELLFINCSLVNIGVKMIPLDSADSAVFSSIKTISDYKFVEIFCTWVRKLKKLHFFWRTISWKIWRFQISRKKFIRQKRVAELVSLLPCNLETRDRNAGEATFPFFLFFCSFLTAI